MSAMERIIVLSNSSDRPIPGSVKATAVRVHNNYEVISLLTSHDCDYKNLVRRISETSSHLFVDLEKKQPLNIHNQNSDICGNLFKRVISAINEIGLIDKLNIYPIKLNDISVSATWKLLTNHYSDVSGLSLGLIGMGNIGTKIAMTLTESGVYLKCFNRDIHKAQKIVDSIVLTKSRHTIASPTVSSCISHPFINTSGVIISASKLEEDISTYIPLLTSKFSIFLVGHSLLKVKALNSFRKAGISIRRLDVGKDLLTYVIGTLQCNNYSNYGKDRIDDQTFCSGGYLGGSGDLIVDNFINPSWCYGECDGLGGMNPPSKEPFINKISQIDELFK